jgi:putative endonuclease
VTAPDRKAADRKPLGNFGERLAAAHLQAKGYRIIDRNFRVREAEIDLIAIDDGALVFVEVRTRRGAYPGMAALSITRGKARKLLTAVEHYIEHRPTSPTCRCGSTWCRRGGARRTMLGVTHIEDAVRPDRR